MSKSKPVMVPTGLKTAGRRLWRGIHDRYGLEVHEELVLLEACRCADRLDRLNTELTRRLTEENRARKLRECRAQQLNLSRMIASLRLPDEQSGKRPQRRGGARGFYGSEAL